MFTWVYPKVGLPFNSNIINVGVEGRFYTNGQDTEVDQNITAAEGRYSGLVSDLRAGTNARLADPLLPKLIAHLEVRTRHLRENFVRTSEFLVSNLIANISEKEAFTDFALRIIQTNPSLLHSHLAKGLAELGLAHNFIESLMQF